jgi:Flp pilus assembly protein TadD
MKKFLYSNLFFLFFLALSVFAVYGKSLSYTFVDFDDYELIAGKIGFLSDFKNIPEFFTSSCFGSKEDVYYRPVLTLSFALDTMFFGNNQGWYYLTNIILFIFSVYCVYILLEKLKFDKTILKMICLIGAVHPACGSSIVWVPGRNDTLLIIFLSLSFLFFMKYIEKSEIKYLIMNELFFIMALFTKETAVIIVPIYFLLVACFDLKIIKKQFIIILLAMGIAISIYFFMRHMFVPDLNVVHRIQNYFIDDIYYKFSRIMIFIKKIILPDNIPIILYKPTVSIIDKCFVLVCFILYLFIYFKKIISKKILIFSFVFFVINISVLLFISDLSFHRLLFSLVAAIILLTALVSNLILQYPIFKKYLIFLFLCVFVSFGYVSFTQADKYKNADVFWTAMFLESPEYDVAWNGVGKRYFFYGNYEEAKKFIKGAKKINNIYDYDLNLAVVYIAEGNLDEAENILLNLLKLREKVASLIYLSGIYSVKGNIKKSYEYAERAMSLDNKNPSVLRHIANLYTNKNEYNKAIEVYKRLLIYDGKKPDYYYNLSIIYEKLGDKKNAELYALKAFGLVPENEFYKKRKENLCG